MSIQKSDYLTFSNQITYNYWNTDQFHCNNFEKKKEQNVVASLELEVINNFPIIK